MQEQSGATSAQASPIPRPALEAFARSLDGQLLGPAHPEFDTARRVWNGMIDKRPAMIVRCASEQDVARCLAFARDYGVAPAARGGGHNVAGHAVPEGGLLIDLAPLRHVAVTPHGTVLVDGGATLGDVDGVTLPRGLAVPLGLVQETGVGGFALHGGYGWLSRRHGLAIDNLVSARVVTADANVRTASEQEHPDLFWALRGGGGNFGVVTRFEFRAHPVAPQVLFSVMFHSLEDAEELLRFFRDWAPSADDDVGVLATLWTTGHEAPVPEHARGRPVAVLAACHSGPPERAERALAPMRGFGRPLFELGGRQPFHEVQRFFEADYPRGRRYYWKSQYLPDLDRASAGLVSQQARTRPSPFTSVDVWCLVPGASRVPADATAFAHRNLPWLVSWESSWDDRAADTGNIEWTRRCHRELERTAGGAQYLNFPGFGEGGEEFLRSAWAANLERLRQIKLRYDPHNLLRGNFNIRP